MSVSGLKKRLVWLAMILSMMTAWGCAGHLVKIKGQTQDPLVQTIPPGSKIFVFEDNRLTQGRQGSLRLRSRVEGLLKKQGFEASDVHSADYFMVMSYGVSSAREIRETIPMVTTYATIPAYVAQDPSVSPPTFQPGGSVTVMAPHTRVVYDIWLIAKLLDGNYYRQTQTMKELWSGKAWISENQATTMGKAVGAMLPYLIDSFGQTTETETIIKAKDFMFQDMF